MSDYTKITDYSAKDALSSGDSVKRVKGSEIGADFDAVAVAVATKANSASPVFTGISSFAVGAVGAPSIYMTGYATTGWYNIGATNWGFAVSGAKVLGATATGLAVTGGLSATGVANFLGGSSLGLTIRSNGLTTEEFNGTDSILVNYNGYLNGTTQFRKFQVFNGKQALIGDFSSTGLAVTGTLSATGTSSLARIDQSNGSINFASLGNGSTSWQIGTQTALKPLDIFTGGVVRAQFSDTGLAVTGDVSVSTKTPASAAAAGVAGTITWDANYLYVCTATNTWKRVAIATW